VKKPVGFWMLCVIFLSTLFLGFGYASFSAVLPIHGTYIGRATVGYFYGGGKNGKDALTVNAYSRKAGIATIEETN
jgi:hypothetical protein